MGAEQKNTFCLAADGIALLSQHIGDLDTVETFDYYQPAIAHFKALCRQDPAIVAHDLHPLYLSTRYATGLWPGCGSSGSSTITPTSPPVWRKTAAPSRCIGLALDGTGYGPDDTVWGGEILVADLTGFTRAGHLAPVRLPGGEAAVRDPRPHGRGLSLPTLWGKFS